MFACKKKLKKLKISHLESSTFYEKISKLRFIGSADLLRLKSSTFFEVFQVPLVFMKLQSEVRTELKKIQRRLKRERRFRSPDWPT